FIALNHGPHAAIQNQDALGNGLMKGVDAGLPLGRYAHGVPINWEYLKISVRIPVQIAVNSQDQDGEKCRRFYQMLARRGGRAGRSWQRKRDKKRARTIVVIVNSWCFSESLCSRIPD